LYQIQIALDIRLRMLWSRRTKPRSSGGDFVFEVIASAKREKFVCFEICEVISRIRILAGFLDSGTTSPNWWSGDSNFHGPYPFGQSPAASAVEISSKAAEAKAESKNQSHT
jgi:hypothetical protein